MKHGKHILNNLIQNHSELNPSVIIFDRNIMHNWN